MTLIQLIKMISGWT